MLNSEKAKKIIARQQPISQDIINRVKNNLAEKGIVLEQSTEWDRYLISNGNEAITFSDGTMVMHTNVSASGFYEELIHYGQIKQGRANAGDIENNLLLEIETKKRLIKNKKAYKITDYEIEVLKDILNEYQTRLNELKKGGI